MVGKLFSKFSYGLIEYPCLLIISKVTIYWIKTTFSRLVYNLFADTVNNFNNKIFLLQMTEQRKQKQRLGLLNSASAFMHNVSS